MLNQAPTIPNYNIISPLGSGTSGHVWLAKDKDGERRAIKVAHFDYVNSPNYQRRFEREVAAQQQLYEVSSHVARIFDYDENHLPPYIIMDYINGIDLNRMIATREIANYDLPTRLHWIEALASTLVKAHSIRIPGDTHGIIHRDIKPQNIRIQGERPYLLDFSISLTSDVEIDNTQDAMTLRYVAPEITASEASDIFSFGLVSFEILYEIHPLATFDEASKIAMAEYIDYVLDKLQKGDWRYPSRVTAELPALNQPENQEKLDAVFQKVLAIEPENRYETTKDFSDDLLAILLGPVSSPVFQAYSSKSTTETPQVTIQFDEKKVQREFSQISDIQETRRFPDRELEEVSSTPTNSATKPQSHSNKSIITEFKPKLDSSIIANGRNLTLLLAGVLGFLFVGLMFVNNGGNNSSGVLVPDVTDEPTVISASSTDSEGINAFDATAIPTITASHTSTVNITASHTASPSPTATLTERATATMTSTSTPTLTATTTLTNTPRATVTPSTTPTTRPTRTPTLAPTATSIPEAWEEREDVLIVNDIITYLPIFYMPEGCVISEQFDALCLEETVWMDLEPVSNETYDLCSRLGICSRPAFGELFDPAGAGSLNPVVGVNLAMAQEYCAWREARLPTGLEWQVLMERAPTAYKGVDEWTMTENPREGQGQLYTFEEGTSNAIWLEDLYLGENLSFRCVRSE